MEQRENSFRNDNTLSGRVETLLYQVSSVVILYPVDSVRDFGVMVSNGLSW